MHIAIYADAHSRSFKRLCHAIRRVETDRPPEVHSDVSQFRERFRAVAYHPDLIILMPAGLNELADLAAVRDLFASSRTIVILPKRESAVISTGHLFRPSFIAFDDDDFGDVAAIVEHLGRHHQCQRCG